MQRIINRLPWRLRNYFICRFLQQNKVDFAGLPVFAGDWPDICNEGRMSIGEQCSFRSFRLPERLRVKKDAELIIGESSHLNDGVSICATLSIRIGHHARIGDMTYIYDTDFHPITPQIPTRHAPVVIGNNVWIGAHAMILPGAEIGDHSVIAAGSIVTGAIAEKSLAAGTPAKVIKDLTIPDDWVR